MQLNYFDEVIKEGTYRKVRYTIRKVHAPHISGHKEWICVYVEKLNEFSQEELEAMPCSITWDSPYSDKWSKSFLTGKQCIGWDYFFTEKEDTLPNVLKDVQKTINYLARNYDTYSIVK